MSINFIPKLLSLTKTNDSIGEFLNTILFEVNSAGYQVNDPSAVCDWRIIGDFEIIYFIAGEGWITIEDELYTFKRGDIAFIPPFKKYKIDTNMENLHEDYWLHFDISPIYLHDNFIKLFGKDNFKFSLGYNQNLEALYKTLIYEIKSQSLCYKTQINGILLQIISIILREINNYKSITCEQISIKNNEVVENAIEFIKMNIEKNISIEDIANAQNISESHLYKEFKKHIKNSPAKFIIIMRLKMVEAYLKTTDLTISQIANKLSFSSPFYLSSIFKKYYLVSPTEFRKNIHF